MSFLFSLLFISIYFLSILFSFSHAVRVFVYSCVGWLDGRCPIMCQTNSFFVCFLFVCFFAEAT